MTDRIITPNSALAPRRMISNGQRIEDLEKRCQMLEYNLAQLAKALAADLDMLMNAHREHVHPLGIAGPVSVTGKPVAKIKKDDAP